LDTVWQRPEKSHLFPILEKNVRLDEAGRQLFGLSSVDRNRALRSLLKGRDPWLAACAAFVADECRLEGFEDDFERLTESQYEALRETASAALQRIREV
jgi:hypothetical protein